MAERVPWQRRIALARGYEQVLRDVNWEWKSDLTFSRKYDNISMERAGRMVIRWIERVESLENMRIGAFYCVARRNDRLHIHALLIGRGRGRGGERTLRDLDPKRWGRAWPCRAKVEAVVSNQRAIHYTTGQNVKNQACENDFYNTDLLNEARIEPDCEIPFGSNEDLRRRAMDRDE